jgi:5'-methylthioadenosine phosphorylase
MPGGAPAQPSSNDRASAHRTRSVTIGIIGGTGLYALEGLTRVREVKLDTPFGEPSDTLTTGELDGVRLVFVPRHGRGHRWLPAEVPYRANIFALKSLGAQWVISISAVGSMKESVHPGEMVIPTQYIDRTHARPSTFFGQGIAAHVSLAEPVCPTLVEHLAANIKACGLGHHRGGTYICIDGPAFSTRAESALFRQWGVDVIGMTALPEARLAREAELHYATLALVTDYDCWHTTEAAVSVGSVVEILKQNTANVRKVLAHAIPGMPGLISAHPNGCACGSALRAAILTEPSHIPEERKADLGPIIGKYVR